MADRDDSNDDGKGKPTFTFDPKLFNDPRVLEAFQGNFNDDAIVLEADDQFDYNSLPAPVKRRIKALKKLQLQYLELEGNFYERVHRLECEFMAEFNKITAKRKDIVNGSVEPTDEECEWEEDEDDEDDDAEDDISENLKSKAKLADDDEKDAEQDSRGISNFWLNAMKNTDLLSSMIQADDEPILKQLTDVHVSYTSGEQPGFNLEFVFKPNEFFSNTTLTKQYLLRFDPKKDDPFSYDGPEIVYSKGSKIDWKRGKNVTQKTIKKKQRHKGKGSTRTVTQTVKSDSFFNFFNQQPYSADDEDLEEDAEEQMEIDFELGHFFRNRLIPRAVLFFTGEAVEDEYDDESEEEEEDAEDEDSDADPSAPPKNPQECQNQQQ
ncbi:Nucleosome assembly protein 1-like 1 [Trichoplax sp. H2]|nr:Nucleosome assembly protein 1-like 1 [Trichoplax sp. H2]|eukprot:RDD43140.1 Nucleosome assembly protein 1-like 1 [Trichoplax sp. H2]